MNICFYVENRAVINFKATSVVDFVSSDEKFMTEFVGKFVYIFSITVLAIFAVRTIKKFRKSDVSVRKNDDITAEIGNFFKR